MKIANYELKIVDSGRFALDGGAMFGVVPKVLWERTSPPDERNRIPLATRNLLLISPDRKILIDNGCGDKWTTKLAQIYKIDPHQCSLTSALAEHGLTPADITDVILTHLHFDHAGGSTQYDAVGNLIPTFPNATYHVQKENWEWAHNPTERDQASYLKADFAPLGAEGMVNLIEGEGEIFPNIRVKVCYGHTAAQQHPIIFDDETTLFYCGDLIPTFAHLPYPWIMGYDLRPLVTLAEKKAILPQALEKNWILFSEHDPHTPAVRLKKGKKGMEIGDNITF
ncbi:MAG: MBL fold metallo-hydrolase [Gemmatimonadetes bacterium]|nr:MAG: MBL fold metallo-hydrolase [Gemmatimonadota bacterium]